MDRIEFDKLGVLEQIEYINNKITEGNTITEICKEILIGRTTVRDRFIKEGYVYNKELGQYYKDNTLGVQIHENITKVPQRGRNQVAEGIKNDNTKELQKYESTKELQKYNTDILELINNKTELLEMLKDYKSNTKIIDMPQLNISSLPEEMQTDIINKSIKIYGPVSKLFDKVCDGYVGYKKQDLISLALYEFCCRYKK
ncbi:DNA-binding protein [Clostridium estertheticum]|uniref:DNA-binding protein n=1 Tax=Clostridium estertheticum TaxID=238834 RepID=UPI001CF43616|nr:DNA-binding protein [Clostridium estertheticum]MCB2308877.1 DNA-binding protein [Clostridium estertheticum]MCB2347289.1 DNA-binding protein [Clostridium estertheticum]MCB2351944.1 DNA-binding protein [Clostridium estertheticum]WAG48491.1 DNA-binding protein [Clostridium estertheticum]